MASSGRQDALARQKANTPSTPIKEDDFATKMMKKMGWKEGAGLGKEGQGMSNPLILQKTDMKTGRIVEGTKREAQRMEETEETYIILILYMDTVLYYMLILQYYIIFSMHFFKAKAKVF